MARREEIVDTRSGKAPIPQVPRESPHGLGAALFLSLPALLRVDDTTFLPYPSYDMP